jgi:chromosome segregation ATPase
MTGQSSLDNQQVLTTLVQATAELAQLNKQQAQKLDTFDAKFDTFDAKIEAIADQIGKLTESMTAFRLDLNDIKEITRQQAETAKAQAESVSQLIALLGKQ